MASFNVGDKVKCSAEYTYDGKTHLASFVRVNTYEIIQIGGKNLPDDRVVIGINGKVTAAVKMSELTNLSNTSTPTPAPEPVPVVETPEPAPTIDSDELAQTILGAYNGSGASTSFAPGSGGGVMLPDSRPSAGMSGDDDYTYTINQIIANKGSSNLGDVANRKLTQSDPSIVQNEYNFPPSKGFDSSKGYYRYDYYMDYERDGVMSGLHVNKDDAIRRSVNIDIMSRGDLVKKYYENYNKFKITNANDILAHSFAHVFFVRPDCNILSSPSSLTSKVSGYSEFYYALKQANFLLRELTQTEAGYNHEFALYLSNKARSFEVSDEYINSGTYGQSLTGFKIPYGKSNVESQAGGKFSIMYHDDRDSHIYHLHKLWTNYISYVYRGKLNPKDKYLVNKVLDYPVCVYYILTAEDGETVIFWSKYWGVFPLDAPSSAFSFNLDNAGGITNPEIKIEYQYAWKEDFNPLSLIEFNTHTRKLGFKYVPSYQASKLGTGYTWAGPPFIETMNNPNGLDLPYTFKLRFRKG